MSETPITILFPEWLREAATAAALKQGRSLDNMLRLAAFEYAEKYAPEALTLQDVPGEQIPDIVLVANSILRSAIEKQAIALFALRSYRILPCRKQRLTGKT